MFNLFETHMILIEDFRYLCCFLTINSRLCSLTKTPTVVTHQQSLMMSFSFELLGLGFLTKRISGAK